MLLGGKIITLKKLLIMTVAYNEEKNIGKVLEGIKKAVEDLHNLCYYEILVVNDGSTDNTANIAKKHANVITHPVNMGYGVAVQTGYKYAIRNKFDYIVKLDSDGQHNPKYILKLLEPILKDEADVVIGSRYLHDNKYETTFTRHLGIKFFSYIGSCVTRMKITDVTSGFRALRIEVAESVVDKFPSRICALEVTILKAFKGFRIKEVGVEMNAREHGGSYLNLKRIAIYPLHNLYVFLKILYRYGGRK